MACEITMPKMGLTMTTGTVAEWLKKVGDVVKKGEELLEITTEKITNVIEAPADGILLKILAVEGAEIPIGAVLGVIGEAGEQVDVQGDASPGRADVEAAPAPEEKAPAVKSTPNADGGKIKIAPAARKLAKELGIEYAGIAGTGPGGRIVKEDIENAAAQASEAQPSERKIKIAPVAKKLATELGIEYSGITGTGPGGRIVKEDIENATAQAIEAQPLANPGPSNEDVSGSPTVFESIPYSGMRKMIGENMSRSWTSAARVTHHVSVDVGRLLEVRKMLNEDEDKGSRVSITDMLCKIVARALEMRPELNAVFDGKTITRFSDVSLGIAVALEKGLVVPVLRQANRKTLLQISSDIKELAKNARENRLSPDDMSNGTFTITNLGAYGSVDFFTPIINQPQVAILGFGRIVETPAVLDGQVVPRPTMGLSLAYDHRVVDGAPAAEFMALFMKLLENPIKTLV